MGTLRVDRLVAKPGHMEMSGVQGDRGSRVRVPDLSHRQSVRRMRTASTTHEGQHRVPVAGTRRHVYDRILGPRQSIPGHQFPQSNTSHDDTGPATTQSPGRPHITRSDLGEHCVRTALPASHHSTGRTHTVLTGLQGTGVPTPAHDVQERDAQSNPVRHRTPKVPGHGAYGRCCTQASSMGPTGNSGSTDSGGDQTQVPPTYDGEPRHDVQHCQSRTTPTYSGDQRTEGRSCTTKPGRSRHRELPGGMPGRNR